MPRTKRLRSEEQTNFAFFTKNFKTVNCIAGCFKAKERSHKLAKVTRDLFQSKPQPLTSRIGRMKSPCS